MSNRAIQNARLRRQLSIAIDTLQERAAVEDELGETWQDFDEKKAWGYWANASALRAAIDVLEKAKPGRRLRLSGATEEAG